MSRVKSFDSTGVAPNGVFFAGDANAIQDHYADLSNYGQTVDVGTLRVGEAGLQLIRYASSPLEARITAALRADGIVRGLSGIMSGAYTTAARDAIPAGQRPFTLVIFNTSTNRLEINMGSDATPNWVAVGFDAIPVGIVMPYTGGEGTVPAGWALAYGQAIVRADFPVLDALYSALGYPFGNGNTTTTFNLPDMRGRVGVGRDNMGGVAANRMTGVTTLGNSGGASTVTLAVGEMPAHDHGGVTASSGAHTHATDNPGNHTHAVTDPTHAHGVNDPTHAHGANTNNIYPSVQDIGGGNAYNKRWGSGALVDSGVFVTVNAAATGVTVAAAGTGVSIQGAGGHTHTALSAGAHTHTISSQGGGGAHQNLQPYLAVNFIVKVQ